MKPELESMRQLVGTLFENHAEEFLSDDSRQAAMRLKFNIETYEFFAKRGNSSRANNEYKQALENYQKILN